MDDELMLRLASLPVRTQILNIDTGERGCSSVEVPLDLRDAILARHRTADAARIAELEREVARLRDGLEEADTTLLEIANGELRLRDGLQLACASIRTALGGQS